MVPRQFRQLSDHECMLFAWTRCSSMLRPSAAVTGNNAATNRVGLWNVEVQGALKTLTSKWPDKNKIALDMALDHGLPSTACPLHLLNQYPTDNTC
eukprot:2883268-Lingulodinium_polyedra.AAC.1